MNSKEKLQTLIQDVFLLDPAEFRFDLKRDEVETWDSFGVVSMAVGVQEAFGYHLTPEEAINITGVEDIMKLLSDKGILFN